MNRDAAMKSFRLESAVSIAQADPGRGDPVTLDSPALDVMTDLKRVKAATVPPSTTLREAEQLMISQGVRMLFVVSRMPQMEGLVTTTDLHGDRQMRLVHEKQARYDEVVVADVMSPLATIDAIDFDDMRGACVGNLIATLKRFGRNHMLVVEQTGEITPRRVRGVISRAQIERQLGVPIEITPIANSFSEIERALG